MKNTPGRSRWALLLAVAASHLVALPAAFAQSSPSRTSMPDFLDEHGPKARIMLLGSFHFAYPNRDVHVPQDRIDVLAPERQREIEEIVELLAEYRPTRVAVEARPERQAHLDSLFREYVAGRWELEANETYQIGFRLARRLGHERVYAVDTERNQLLINLAEAQLAPREKELLETDPEWTERFRRLNAYEDSIAALRPATLREMFVGMNSPDQIRRSHLPYSVRFFKFDGEEGGYAGADFVSGWYNRNLRIFRNLQRITGSPGERILLIIGSGHLPILRFVAEHSPEYELVEANAYLAAPGR